MKRLALVLLLLGFTTLAYSAELLVRAKPHWLDNADTSKMTASELESFNARSQIGDVIVVRSDGWEWGKEECLPDFIIVKVPGMTLGEVRKYYEEPLQKQEVNAMGEVVSKMLKHRKYQIPLADVNEAKATSGVLVRTKASIINNIKEKTE